MQGISLSVGYLHNASELIRIVYDNPDSNLETIEEIVSTDKIIIRNISQKLISMSLDIGWITIDEDNLVYINKNIQNYFNKSPIKLQRELLWIYIESKRPSWTKYLHRGVKIVSLRITDSDEKQVFQDLSLFVKPEDTNPEILRWWSKAAIFSRSITDQELLETGNKGEFLSLNFEKERTGKNPIHAAYYSHSYGYDIESQINKIDSSPLYIEVKSSSGSWKIAKLYLTRSEYETCKKKGSSYIFHLWDLSSEISRLVIVNGHEILKLAPLDKEGGNWTEFSIDFSQFLWDDAYEIE